MISKMKVLLLLILTVTVSGIANAAGFSIYEWSARGEAMGGAVLANKAEPASIASNPALITKLEGVQVQAGLFLLDVSAKTKVAGVERKTESKIFYIPNVYLTGKLRDNFYFGFGLFSRFGLGETYENYKTWIGSLSAYESSLETFSFNPNIAIKVNNDLSIAVGLEGMMLNFKEKKYINGSFVGLPVDSELSLEGDSIAWGKNFAVYYNPSFAKEWAAALTYRTKVSHDVEGKVKSNYAFTAAAPTGDANANITLPDSLSFGLSFNPMEELVVEADIIRTFWSSYSELRLDYKDGTVLAERKDYKDVYRFQLGAEYSLNKNWDIRAGYVFDQSPINEDYMDTLVPAHDRNIYSVGVGYHQNNWGIDFTYAYLAAVDFSGKGKIATGQVVPISYSDSTSNIIGLNVKYAF